MASGAPPFPPALNMSVHQKVVDALLKRALGYETDVAEVTIDAKGKRVRRVRRHFPPDVRAQCFWLKNCQPRKWQAKAPPPRPGKIVVRVRPID